MPTPPDRAYPVCRFKSLQLSEEISSQVRATIYASESYLQEMSNYCGISNEDLTNSIEQNLLIALRYRETFKKVFEYCRPKAVFLASYYFPRYMGLIWAAHQLGIPTIDIQHGKQGKFQGMYSHWSKIPDSGYALLPTWFWSWGQQSVDNIMKWQENRSHHRCVIGGFPWITRWRNKGWEAEKFIRPDCSKSILITTQAPVGGFEDFFPDFIVEAISNSPDDWIWIVREHPNYKEGNMEIKRKLEQVEVSKYLIDVCNELPLYSVLGQCDFHVTAYSTVCYEAETFDVPTAIFSDIGNKLYKEEISEKRFVYVDSARQLIQATLEFKPQRGCNKYIESDPRLIESVLDNIGCAG